MKFQLEALEGAAASLSREYSEVIRGIYFEGKSRKEICRRLFISENTLHRRRKKAIEAMAEMISIIF